MVHYEEKEIFVLMIVKQQNGKTNFTESQNFSKSIRKENPKMVWSKDFVLLRGYYSKVYI